MKMLLALAIALTTTVAMAKTLGEYDASRSYIVAWPSVVFSNLSIPVKNVCVDGDNLKTVNAQKYCSEQAVVEVCTTLNHTEECRAVRKGETPVQKPGTRLVYGCVAYNTANFETTRSYEAQVCTKWEQVQNGSHNTSWLCTEFGTETKEYALSYEVSVSANGTDHSGRVEVAKLNFTIPQCK